MDISASIVKAERLSRSWTQQHLADACNISLRTIQRVEKFGNASPDTIMELCSILGLKPDDLVILPEDTDEEGKGLSSHLSSSGVIIMMAAAVLLGGIMGGIFTYILMSG